MDDRLTTSEIKERSFSGAKWLIITNAFGAPAAYLIALILGRSGPSSLGAFALAQISIGAITTFAMFGGPSVLRNFMPKISGSKRRGAFLFSYSLILTTLIFVFLSISFFFPITIEFLLQRELDVKSYSWFVLLTFVVVYSECLMAAASGLMHIKLSAIARIMGRIIILPLVGGLLLLNHSLLIDHALETILSGFLLAYVLSTILSLVGLWRDPRFKMKIAWYLPDGFVSFSFTSTAAMVFSFLYANFDRMVVLSLSDLEGLGKYQAVVSLAMLIEFLPNILQAILVPTFSSLLASSAIDAYKRAFYFVYRNTVILMTVLALSMMSFSREILTVFGETYGSYNYLLALFCFANIVRSPAFATMAVLTSMEKNSLRFAMSTVQIVLQIVGTVSFIDSYGVLAIAGSKLIAVMIASTIGHLYVIYHIRIAPNIPRSFYAAVLTGLITLILRIMILPDALWTSFLLTIGSLVSFGLLAKITPIEILNLSEKIFTKKDRIRVSSI